MLVGAGGVVGGRRWLGGVSWSRGSLGLALGWWLGWRGWGAWLGGSLVVWGFVWGALVWLLMVKTP